MRLSILSGYENQVCLTNPHAFLVHSQHVLEDELLPWHQGHLNDVAKVFDILQLVFALEKWTVKPWLGCPS